ncbi:MAG: hypothetical protein ACXVNQ_06415 [Bacteroidia bacterium]
MKKSIILVLMALWFNTLTSWAQNGNLNDTLLSIISKLDKIEAEKTTTNKFVMLGDAFTGVRYTNDPHNSKNNRLTTTTTGVNPVFLWTVKDKLIVESEVEFQLRGDNTSGSGFAADEGLAIELEYMNLGYIVNKYLTFRIGSFFSSYGTFEDWQHQRLTNRMISRPLGIGHGGLEPGTSLGLNFRGAFPVGSARLNYSLDVVNAPTLVTGSEVEATDSSGALKGTKAVAGQLDYEVIKDGRISKAIGGRIGFIPFPNSSLELGVSAHHGKVGERGTQYENVAANFLGFDLSYTKDIEDIKGTVLFRGQYDHLAVDKATYSYSFTDNGGNQKTINLAPFDNKSDAYYLQLSYRPSMIKDKFLRRLELTGRYCVQNIPTGTTWANDGPTARTYGYKSQFGVCLNYWIEWNAVIKFSYEGNQWQNYRNSATKPPQNYFVQMAIGF